MRVPAVSGGMGVARYCLLNAVMNSGCFAQRALSESGGVLGEVLVDIIDISAMPREDWDAWMDNMTRWLHKRARLLLDFASARAGVS